VFIHVAENSFNVHFILLQILVIAVKVVMDRVSQRSKGFGFVQYASEADAERAKAEMNGKVCALYLLAYFSVDVFDCFVY
jgi:RNA recognition motif-containing protein